MPTPGAYAALADMYLSHPNFAARYEALAQGFAGYLAPDMKNWANRQP